MADVTLVPVEENEVRLIPVDEGNSNVRLFGNDRSRSGGMQSVLGIASQSDRAARAVADDVSNVITTAPATVAAGAVRGAGSLQVAVAQAKAPGFMLGMGYVDGTGKSIPVDDTGEIFTPPDRSYYTKRNTGMERSGFDKMDQADMVMAQIKNDAPVQTPVVDKYLREGFFQAGNMLPTLPLAAIPVIGPEVSVQMMAQGAGADAIKKGRELGLTDEEIDDYKSKTVTPEYVGERLSIAPMLAMLNNKVPFFKALGTSTLAEVGSELGTSHFQLAADKAYEKPGLSKEERNRIYDSWLNMDAQRKDPAAMAEWVGNMKDTAITTLGMTHVMGAAGGVHRVAAKIGEVATAPSRGMDRSSSVEVNDVEAAPIKTAVSDTPVTLSPYQNEAYDDTEDMPAPKGPLETAASLTTTEPVSDNIPAFAPPATPVTTESVPSDVQGGMAPPSGSLSGVEGPDRAITEADQADFENAVLWENNLRQQGRSAVPDIEGEAARDQAWRLLETYRKAITPMVAGDSAASDVQYDSEPVADVKGGVTSGATDILPNVQNQGAGQVDGQRVAVSSLQKEVSGVGSDYIQSGGLNDLSSVQQETGLAQEVSPVRSGDVAAIDEAAHAAATSPYNSIPEPTQAQIEAGNYKKGHINLHGLDIAIENPAGSVRKGVDETGKAWQTELAHHYGYIKGTIGNDKDHVDVFVGPKHGSGKVFVIDQINPGTGKLDEHKVMLSFDSLPEAKAGYLANYDKGGAKRIGAITETTADDFKQWLSDGDTKKAFAPVVKTVAIAENAAKFAQTRLRALERKLKKAQGPEMKKKAKAALDAHKATMKDAVSEPVKEVASAPVVPLSGEVGADVLAEWIKTLPPKISLRTAARMNEPGGLKIVSRQFLEANPGHVVEKAVVAETATKIPAKSPKKILETMVDEHYHDKTGQFIGPDNVANSKEALERIKTFAEENNLPVPPMVLGGISETKRILSARATTGTVKTNVPRKNRIKKLQDKIETGALASTERDELNKLTAIENPAPVNVVAVPAGFGDGNKLFTRDKADRARDILRAKLNQLNAGLDPEMVTAGIDLAGYYIEGGFKSFKEYSGKMVEDLGESIKPFLKSFYLAVRNYPGFDNKGTDSEAAIDELLAVEVVEAAIAPKILTKHGNKTLRGDYGVKSIDAYSTAGEKAKSAFLSDAKVYLKEVGKVLADNGYTLEKINSNPGGVAVSGDVSLLAFKDDSDIGVYVTIGAGTSLPMVSQSPSGVQVMYRATTRKNKYQGLVNRWDAGWNSTTGDLAGKMIAEAQKHEPATVAEKPLASSTSSAIMVNEKLQTQEGAPDEIRGNVENTVADGKPGRIAKAGRKGDSAGSTAGSTRDVQPAGSRHSAGNDTKPAGKPVVSGAGAKTEHGSNDGAGDSVKRHDGILEVMPLNYRISDADNLGKGGAKQKARDNIAAVRLVKLLTTEERPASPEEKAQLVKYVGWGASELANGVFENTGYNPATRGYNASWFKEGWEDLGKELKDLLSPEEYNAAKKSTVSAYYTPAGIVNGMYYALERMGFTGGRMIEPGTGVGHFIGMLPDKLLASTRVTGVELDNTSAAIAKLLYPGHDIRHQGFEKFVMPDGFYDVAIGNPPFVDLDVTSDPAYARHKFKLHDYFFAKSIDKVRPGGLLMFVTSKGTMDKANDKARAYLSERADLLGAIRLPETAFKENAGTETVTDVIFLRKRAAGEESTGKAWSTLKEVKTPDGKTHINEYFADHPEMVLGKNAITSSQFGPKYTVLPLNGTTLAEQFNFAVKNYLPNDIYKRDKAESPADRSTAEYDLAPSNIKEGAFYLDKSGAVMSKESGVGVPSPKNSKDLEIVKSFIPLRDAVRQVLYVQIKGGDLVAAQKDLKKQYDAFVKKHGVINSEKRIITMRGDKESISVRTPNFSPFRDDPDAYLVASIEQYNPDSNSATPGPLFTERTIKPEVIPQINSITDALHVVMHESGVIDIPQIAAHMNVTEAQAIDALGAAIYHNPQTMQWETDDEYLSGNVKQKLALAESSAQADPAFKRNVDALTAVQPDDLPPSRISIGLGEPIVKPEHIEQFAKEVISMGINVSHLRNSGSWGVEKVSGYQTTEATSDWGTARRNAAQLIDDALNSRQIRIEMYVMIDGKETKVFDKDATNAANEKLAKIKERFAGWVWEHAQRSEEMSRAYNNAYNNTVKRVYGGDHINKMTFPGMSAVVNPFEHQKRVAWRVVQSGNTYMAHSVGAGKTIGSILAGMELKRLGIKKKPCWVVPNHMLKQFASEFLQLYPAAKIMVADENQFSKENRNRFMGRVAAENWDGIIITHSAFGKMQVSPDFSAGFIRDQIDELDWLLNDTDTGERLKRKQIEQAKARLEQRLEKVLSAADKDKGVTFEETGIDQLFVDEAHEFRKLDFTTNQTNIKGIDPNGSLMSFDLYVKSRYLEKLYPGRSLVLMSGTAITNTIGEIFTIQRFLQEGKLKELGLDNFDAWASTFGDLVTKLEATPAGNYKPVTRFAKFKKLASLSQLWSEVGDFIHAKDLTYINRPSVKSGGRILVTGEQSPVQQAYKRTLADRIKAIERRKRPPQKGDDILLSVITDGRHAALDERYVSSGPASNDNKLEKMVSNVAQIWKDTKKDKLTQMVFCDLGTPGSEERRGFSAYNQIVESLVKQGVPAKEIAIMQSYKKSDEKQKLFRAMNEGTIRVLIGSSEAMGTGVNAQKKLVALHHLDPDTYLPSNIEQREGRIVRQGNSNDEVQLYAYVTKGSYDETMWQFLETKQRFIDQFLSGEASVDEATDIDGGADSFAMARAMSSDNPLILERAGIESDIQRLESLRRAHFDDQQRLKSNVSRAEQNLPHYRKEAAALEKVIARRIDTAGDKFALTLGGATFDERRKAGEALGKAIDKMLTSADKHDLWHKIGTVAGLDIMARSGIALKMPWVTLEVGVQGTSSSPVNFQGLESTESLDPVGVSMKLENLARSYDRVLADINEQAAKDEKTLKDSGSRIGRAFEHAETLADKQQRLNDIETILKAEERKSDAGEVADSAANFALAPENNSDTMVKGGNDYGTGQGSNQRVLSPGAVESARQSIKSLAADLAGNDSSDGQDSRAWKSRQDATARQWALKNNLPVISSEQFLKDWEAGGKKQGGENSVYFKIDPVGNKWAIKMNDLGYHKGDMSALMDRLDASSQLFPDTTNQIIGMVETPSGIRPLLQQPFVVAAKDAFAPTLGIARELNRRGFVLIGADGGMWLSPGRNYYVSDMGKTNVILDEHGELRFIDAMFERIAPGQLAKEYPNFVVPSPAVQFKLTDSPTLGLKATEAQAWVKTLPIAKHVNVVQSIINLPENARNEITKAGYGAHRIQAMELHGTLHVITDNIPDMRRVKALVIGHELAHAGQTKKIVDLAVDWFKRTKEGKTEQARSAHTMLQRIADSYGYDLENDKHFRRAVQEATAAIAEQVADGTLKPVGLMQRLFMYIKHWLRQNGLISHVSDSELSLAVAEMLRIGEKRLSVGKGGEEAMFAAAWHGSPHDHNGFSTEFIDSGEGAQSYGYGLYFAGDKAVAEHYRDNLSRGNMPTFSKDDRTLSQMEALAEYFKPGRIIDGYGGKDKVVKFSQLDNGWQWGVEVVTVNNDGTEKRGERHRFHSTQPASDKIAKVLSSEGYESKQGHLYQVELSPKEDEYLLWDKSLSDQSEKVKAAISRIDTFASVYKKIDEFIKQIQHISPRAASLATEMIHGSETTRTDSVEADKNWEDLYKSISYDKQKEVGLDLNDIHDYADALVENGRSGEQIYHDIVGDLSSDEAASEYLHSLGIRGIKYLDGSSRGKDGGNYNYVIFNDADVEIKAKFALSEKEQQQTILKISEAGTLGNLKNILNPLDYSRFRTAAAEHLPHNATTWLADNLGNPFWMKENNPAAVPFYEEAKDREVTRMDNNIRMFGGLVDKEGKRVGWEKAKGLFDWTDKTTAWGKIRQEQYNVLTDKQKNAYDVIRFEGDAYNKTYAGLADALRNQRIKAAGMDAQTFRFYQAAMAEEAKAFDVKLAIAQENMAEAGMTPEDIEGHISEYRARYKDIEGWVHRDHGEGEYQVRVYQTVDRLDFDVDKVQHKGEETDRIRLGTFPGAELSQQMEKIIERRGGSFKQLRNGAIVILTPKGQGQKILDEFNNIPLVDKDGDYKYKVLAYSRFVSSVAQAKKLTANVKGNYAAAMPRNFREGYSYETSWSFSAKLNEDDYQVLKTSDMKLELILRNAIDKAKAKSEISEADATGVQDALVQSVAEILLGRGAGLYQIRRAQYLIEGYDTDNAIKKYEDYINGTAGLFSKARYALRQFKNMKSAAPKIRAWATKYVGDSLRNMGTLDKWSGNIRAIVSLWYLGFNTSWMLVNSTQPYVLGQAELSRYTTSPLLKIAKAEKDILTGKLSTAELALLEDMQVRSQDHDSVMAEMTGSLEGVTGAASQTLHNVTQVAMALGQKVEVLNRHTMIIAGYRVFKDQGMDHETALTKALDVNSMVNIDMGRYNLPGWARGPIGRTFYALQSYIQHMLNYLWNRSSSGNRNDQKAILRLLFAMFLIGGLPAGAPGSDELDKLIRMMFGYSPKLALKSWSRKMAKEYDTPGEMLEGFVWHGVPGAFKPFGVGVSLTGATQLRMPIISNVIAGDDVAKSLGGPVWGLGQKGWMSFKAAMRGDWGRATEYLLPTAIANPLSAVRQATDGVKTASGKRVEYKGKQLKMEPHEAAIRAFGLQPVRTADISETRGFEKNTQAEWNDRRKDALDNYRMSRKLKHIAEFNKGLRGSQAKGLVSPISPESLANVWGKTNIKKSQWQREHGAE